MIMKMKIYLSKRVSIFLNKDLQYFLDNDQMLGRDSNTYTINQVLPKTEDELQYELEITLNQINENYLNNESLSNCNEILCKYFKSKILNTVNSFNLLNENQKEGNQAKRKSSKKILLIRDKMSTSKENILSTLDLINSPSLFLHRLKFLEYKQSLSTIKKVGSFLKNNKKNSNNLIVKEPSYNISNDEDLKLFSQSLSTDSITDLSFKNIINTILSYTEKNLIRQKNQFYHSFKQVIHNNPIEITDNKCISRKNSFNSEEDDDEKPGFMTPQTKLSYDQDNKSIEFLKDAKEYCSNKSYNSFSKDESYNENPLDESNITEMINDNIKTKENLKVLLLGDKIPKKKFAKGLIYSEDYDVTEFEINEMNDKIPT